MPTYLYKCPACTRKFNVVKSYRDLDEIENCPACQTDCDKEARQLAAPMLDKSSMRAWNEPEYNPGLGQVTYGKYDRERKAKQAGLVEIGNEKLETIHKTFDRQREDTRDQRWKDADREMVYEPSKD